MNLKRFIGKSERFPDHYIELFQNQQKEVVSRQVYNRKTLKGVRSSSFSKEELALLESLQKKDFSIVKGEEFKRFMVGQKAFREFFRNTFTDNDTNLKFLYGDYLFDGNSHVCFYDSEEMTNVVMSMNLDTEDAPNQFTLFTIEQLGYPSILFFIHKSVKEDEVVLFVNPMNTSDNRTSFAVYKSADSLYVAQIKNEVDVIKIKKYDQNFREVSDISELESVHQKMEEFILKRVLFHLEKDEKKPKMLKKIKNIINAVIS